MLQSEGMVDFFPHNNGTFLLFFFLKDFVPGALMADPVDNPSLSLTDFEADKENTESSF